MAKKKAKLTPQVLADAKARRAVRGKLRDRTLKSALGAAVRNDKRRRGLGTEGLPPEVKAQLAKMAATSTADRLRAAGALV